MTEAVEIVYGTNKRIASLIPTLNKSLFSA